MQTHSQEHMQSYYMCKQSDTKTDETPHCTHRHCADCVMCSIKIRVSSETRKGESLEAILLQIINGLHFPLAEGYLFLFFFPEQFLSNTGVIGTKHLFLQFSNIDGQIMKRVL